MAINSTNINKLKDHYSYKLYAQGSRYTLVISVRFMHLVYDIGWKGKLFKNVNLKYNVHLEQPM